MIKKIALLLLMTPTGDTLCRYKVIAFDLYGVLFEIPTKEKIRFLGAASLKSFIAERCNIFTFKTRYLNGLHRVPVCPNLFKLYQKNFSGSLAGEVEMSPIMYLWQAGKINSCEALEKSIEQFKREIKAKREFEMFELAAQITFDPKTRIRCYKPILEGVRLLELCSKQKLDGDKIYALSNMDKEMIKELKKEYPEIFSKFDGVFYSGKNGSLKPEAKIYKDFLTKYNIKPTECIFIDDQAENTKEAREHLIYGITCKRHSQVKSQLENLGVLKKPNKCKIWNKIKECFSS